MAPGVRTQCASTRGAHVRPDPGLPGRRGERLLRWAQRSQLGGRVSPCRRYGYFLPGGSSLGGCPVRWRAPALRGPCCVSGWTVTPLSWPGRGGGEALGGIWSPPCPSHSHAPRPWPPSVFVTDLQFPKEPGPLVRKCDPLKGHVHTDGFSGWVKGSICEPTKSQKQISLQLLV